MDASDENIAGKNYTGSLPVLIVFIAGIQEKDGHYTDTRYMC